MYVGYLLDAVSSFLAYLLLLFSFYVIATAIYVVTAVCVGGGGGQIRCLHPLCGTLNSFIINWVNVKVADFLFIFVKFILFTYFFFLRAFRFGLHLLLGYTVTYIHTFVCMYMCVVTQKKRKCIVDNEICI